MKRIPAFAFALAAMTGVAYAQSSAPAVVAAPAPSVVILNQVDASYAPMSKIIGAKVYNTKDEHIGEVENLLVDRNGTVHAAVVSVGGFLGIGEKQVAVSYKSLQVNFDKNNDPKIVVDLTKETLGKASEYKKM